MTQKKSQDQSFTLPLLDEAEARIITRDGEERHSRERILHEHALVLETGNTLIQKTVCIPQYLRELAAGQLLTQGWIRSRADLIDISFDDCLGHARVTLAGESGPRLPLPMAEPGVWTREWVFALADRFAEGSPLHEITYATHSCLLAREGEILFACEDIGRHNALDKCVGYALLQGIDLHSCMLYSSGRIPLDMASKAIRSGIPTLVSKASPTREAVRLAQDHHLTLICNARRDRMRVFTDFGL